MSGYHMRLPVLILSLLALACGGRGDVAAPAPTGADGGGPAAASGPAAMDPGAFGTLRATLERRIAMAPGEVAVTVMDLETGARWGHNADVSMHAASTMKVPVLLELFRQAAEGRYRLDDPVRIRTTFTSIADGSTYQLTAQSDSENALYRMEGRTLPREELARRMIVRSSNLATNILIEEVDAGAVRRTMERLGAPDMNVLRGVEDIPAYERGMNNTTTADALATVMTAIAACEAGDVAEAMRPLTPEDCGRMAEILAGQEFTEGIPAGVPTGVRVANKTGWITGIDHDAAIVYPQGRSPYVLVVLTRGIEEEPVSARVIRELSELTWDGLMGPELADLGLTDRSELESLHRTHRVAGLEDRTFNHERYWGVVDPVLERSGTLTAERIGASVEGRDIRAVSYGSGPATVLLWSQMHGNESTASMSLADIFAFLTDAPEHPLARRIGEALTVVAVPMLNPDGAQRFRRRNAMGIDINRDARQLTTPEARALKGIRDRLEPEFGFNLHDQNVRTTVGETGRTAAIALLAPPWSASRDDDEVRERAKRVAAVVRLGVEPVVEGRVARYDDTFNPRAFGDLMQQWGTSTVLIESGGWAGDPEKQHLRLANFVGILAALDAIATGAYDDVNM
ncbi:MAG TPA: serine hydrolase, partial [Longimicrobiales bacterium]|nr:serine hydrolase [Longimicrobiales bacterium]